MPDAAPEDPNRRRVRRGEGEVTEWPRGLTGYVPAGPADALPPADGDRTANRLAFAARLLGLLRARGQDVDREVDALRSAEAALARGDRGAAARRVDDLLAGLEGRMPRAGVADTR